MKIALQVLVLFLACCFLSNCSYMKQTFKQAGYENQFKRDNKKSIQKHLLTSETFFVYGKFFDKCNISEDNQLAVAAMARTNDNLELVDITHLVRTNSFYALHLPAGDFQLLVLADSNADGFYTDAEIVTTLPLHLDKDTYPYLVAGDLDITCNTSHSETLLSSIRILLPPIKIRVQKRVAAKQQDSLFYPKGSIRQLEDQIFSKTNAMLGMYSPAEFMEIAPMMFYALEEEIGHKIPVVFVHGVGGSVTEFSSIIEKLDRQRYKIWFYYYPSGADLKKLAHLFYRIFLSGKVVHQDTRIPYIIVAHSMGGLIVRQAFNFYKGVPEENKIDMFVSIATPFGGHPDAQMGIEMAPMVLPSWYNMNPDGEFIKNLYKKPLPEFIDHRLFYAYGNSSTLKLGENSDGVVPMSSQLYPPAQEQSTRQYGYNRNHTNILEDKDMIANLIDLIGEYKIDFPEEHLQYLIKGGFDVQLSDSYTDFEKYAIRYLGKYISALAQRILAPVDKYGSHFLSVLEGEATPNLYTESAWLKFREEYPELANEVP